MMGGKKELKNLLEGKEKVLAPYKVADTIFNLYREGKISKENFDQIVSLFNEVSIELGALQSGAYKNEEVLGNLKQAVKRVKELLYGDLNPKEEDNLLHALSVQGWTTFVPEVWFHLSEFLDENNLPHLARQIEENLLQGPVNGGAWVEIIPNLPNELQETLKTIYWGYYFASIAQELTSIQNMLRELNIEKILQGGTEKVLEEILYKLERIESRFDVSVQKTNQKVENTRMNLKNDFKEVLSQFAEKINEVKDQIRDLEKHLAVGSGGGKGSNYDPEVVERLRQIHSRLDFIWKDLNEIQMSLNRIEGMVDGIWTEVKYRP